MKKPDRKTRKIFPGKFCPEFLRKNKAGKITGRKEPEKMTGKIIRLPKPENLLKKDRDKFIKAAEYQRRLAALQLEHSIFDGLFDAYMKDLEDNKPGRFRRNLAKAGMNEAFIDHIVNVYMDYYAAMQQQNTLRQRAGLDAYTLRDFLALCHGQQGSRAADQTARQAAGAAVIPFTGTGHGADQDDRRQRF